jgi:2-methylcitrate dehydratase PrpD
MKSQNRLAPEDIARVKVKINKAAYNHVCHPLESKRRPSSIPDAQFSLPYCLAVALTRGDVFLSDFTPKALKDERVLGLSDKIEVVVDPEIERLSGREIGFSEVEVTTNEQKTSTARVEKVKGHPQNPMTMDEVKEKFQKCAALSVKTISGDNLARLTDLVEHLEECPDVARIAELMR